MALRQILRPPAERLAPPDAATLARVELIVHAQDSVEACLAPMGLAGDLARMLRYYAAHWHKSRAVLSGYSQGADVLPFAVNRLPASARALLAHTVLMSIGEKASFEFHLSKWLRSDRRGLPIRPELDRLSADSTLCLYSADDAESLCPKIAAGHVRAQPLPGGRHFDGDYARLSSVILARIQLR